MSRRTIPHEPEVEQSIIGAVLYRGHLAAEIACVALTPDDFYDPFWRDAFECISNLWDHGSELDTVTIAACMRDRTAVLDSKDINVRLIAALNDLPSGGERALTGWCERLAAATAKRRLIAISEDINRLGHEGTGSAAELLDEARDTIEAVSVQSTTLLPEGLQTLDAFLAEADDQGDDFSPWLIPGVIKADWRVVIVGGEGSGKGLALDTPLPTPDGWTTMGDVAPGQTLIGGDGKPCTVTHVSPIHNRPCFRVKLSDGSTLIADDEHRWQVVDYAARQRGHARTVVTTLDLLNNLRVRDGFCANYAIPLTAAEFPPADLPIDPYVLGAWLGDGVVRSESGGDVPEMLDGKLIPLAYLRSSYDQRADLLAGLVDTVGHADALSGQVEITLTNQRLSDDVLSLVKSLGIAVTVTENDDDGDGRWHIKFHSGTARDVYRYVVSVTPVESVPTKCITVDSTDRTYIAGHDYVVTHNTVLMRQIAIAASGGIHPFTYERIEPVRTMLIDLENPRESLRSVCAPMHEQVRNFGDFDPDRCWIWRSPQGIDLTNRRDRSQLEASIRAGRPDVVCMGPAYKMTGGTEDYAAIHEALAILDQLRVRYGFALVLEHHAPHGDSLSGRAMRPSGSALWKRWPEMGIGITPVSVEDDDRSTLERFRGDRLSNDWPEVIVRSDGPWPWACEFGAPMSGNVSEAQYRDDGYYDDGSQF